MKSASSYARADVHHHAMHQAFWWLLNNEGEPHSNEGEGPSASASFLRLHIESKTTSAPIERREGRLLRREGRMERREVERRDVRRRRVIP